LTGETASAPVSGPLAISNTLLANNAHSCIAALVRNGRVKVKLPSPID
jgi:hypothetical protein